jgi:MYXO-CTERM domain-containing protein
LVAFVALVSASPRAARAQTVEQVVATHAGGCTSAGVDGLSAQLLRSHLCAYPGAVAEFTPHPNITLTSGRVHPLGASQTVAAIRAAADRTPLSVNSAFRTLVEQYLLYEEGGCGLAAVPGRSNHQTGRAVDLGNYSAALSAMTAAGCSHPYPSSDPVHFDCPGPDMRAESVRVFQRLWNANHPEDRIAEDGAYGPQTGARLGRSPSAGFATDLCVTEPVAQWGARFLMQTFPLASEDPIVLRPGEELVGTIELENIGTETWDASTRLATTEPRDRPSELAGPDWASPSRAAAVDSTVAPGDSFPFTFTLRAPDAPGEYREHFGVVQEGVAWFSDPSQLGPPDTLLEVRVLVVAADPDAGVTDTDASVPAPDAGVRGPGRPPGVDGCGCRAAPTGRPSWPMLVCALGTLLLVRRRR